MRIKRAALKLAKLLLFTASSVMGSVAHADPSLFEPLFSEQAFFPLTAPGNNKVPVDGLAAALRATMAHNPMLKGKQAEVDEQQYRVSSAQAQRYPTLSGQANNVSDDNDEQATLRLDQPLWAFGKIDTAIAQAQSGVTAQQWGLLDIQRQLLEETATTYAKIEGIVQRGYVAQRNIDAHHGYYQRIERRQKGQLSSQADVRLAYSRLLQAQAQLESIKGELLIAQTDLQALTQVHVTTELAVDPQLAQLPSQAEILRLAIEKQANVHVKRQNIQMVKLDLKAEQLAQMPTLYFRVETDLVDNGPADSVRAGLSIESRFEGLGFVSRGRIKGAESRLVAAQYDLDNSLNDVRRRVNTLMQNRQVQEGLIKVQELTVDAMQETLDSFLRQYKTGRKSWLEVLNMQRELTTLQLQSVQIKNDWLILSLRVASLIGALDQQAGLNITKLNKQG